MDGLAQALQEQLMKAHEVMLGTCTTETPFSRHCFKRTQGRTFTRLLEESKAAKRFLLATSRPGTGPSSARDLADLITCLQKACPDLCNHPALEGSLVTPDGAREAAYNHLQTVNTRAANMRLDKTKRHREAARANFQAKLAKAPKSTHRTIFKDTPSDDDPAVAHPEINPLTALRDPDTGKVHTDPQAVIDVMQKFMGNLMAPTGVVNTGKYLPDDRPPGFRYPFTDPNCPDNFKLERQSGPGFTDPKEADMLELLMELLRAQARNTSTLGAKWHHNKK